MIASALVVIALVMISCSQESNSMTSRFWHNMTARYNAYFLAKERMKIVEDKLWASQTDDYNRLLELFPLVDTTFAQSIKEDLDYIFERASITPTKHKNSNWVDDSYILIGRLKLYECKYDSATFAFKYVNTKSKDDEARFVALSWLIRAYLLNGENRFAKDIHTYLQSQKLTGKAKLAFYLSSAQYYRVNENYEAMGNQLKKAIPLVKWDTDYRSRLNYIVGQIYQKAGNNDSAYHHYNQVLKRNPPYDLSFFAKLNMSQVSNPTEEKEIKKVRSYFDKMLVDLKNEEFRDRIYYDMAQFELKQGKIDTAISLLNQSLRVEGGVTPHMNAYSYLSLGKVHYTHPTMDNLTKYSLAKLYYDSTVTNMDSLFDNFDFIVERRGVLEKFVYQIETIQREDSLQSLAKMDEATLSTYLDDVKIKEEARLKKEARNEQARISQMKKQGSKAQASANNSFFDPDNIAKGSGFVFYDPAKSATSLFKFKERWGDRTLEDNWRRSVKDVAFDANNENISTSEIDSISIIKTDSIAKAKEDSIQLAIENISVNKQDLYKDIPQTTALLNASNDSLKKAFYRLGKIYDQDLEEPENAIATFEELLERFPNHDKLEEVLYFLYILCGKSEACESDYYKNLLLNDYSSSMYAKVIEDPDYITDAKLANRKVHKEYEQAYALYQNASYVRAYNEVTKIKARYPHNDIQDKLDFLHILTFAKTDRIAKYKSSLPLFIQNHKESKLVPFAEELIAELNKKGPSFVAPVDTIFSKHPDVTKHFFIAFFKDQDITYKENLTVFNEFKTTYYRDSSYTSRRIDFDTSQYMIVIKEFKTSKNADEYHKKLIHWNKFSGHYKEIDYNYYIIDEKNYAILLRRRNKEAYETFYKQAYR